MKKLLIIPLLVVLDQLTKFFLSTSSNTGAAFGMLHDQTPLLIIVSLAALVYLVYHLFKYKTYVPQLVLVISGVIGNLIDRLFFGYIRDFIDLGFWPSFNIADSMIFAGILWLILVTIRPQRKPFYSPKK